MARYLSPGSMAAYRSAAELPDRDDDEPCSGPPRGPSTWFAVEWFAPQICRDVTTGQLETHTCPVSRYFDASRHGSTELAELAARRWAYAMTRRLGPHAITWHEGDDAGNEDSWAYQAPRLLVPTDPECIEF